MTETIHLLVERYGLIAVFLGCVAEGETAAILAGFFAHQGVFATWSALAATASGAFLGDVLLFLAGRRYAAHPLVARLRTKPGFSHAHRLVTAYPATYVLINRYVYGFRLVGGIAAGLSGIPVGTFMALNAVSALVWAALFCTLGYVFGLGAERMLGVLAGHERLLIALAIGLAAGLLAWRIAHIRRQRAAGSSDP